MGRKGIKRRRKKMRYMRYCVRKYDCAKWTQSELLGYNSA